MLRGAHRAASRGRTEASWRARDALREFRTWMIREPQAGVNGWGFLITGCLMEVLTLLVCRQPGDMRDWASLCAVVFTAISGPHLTASAIIKWRRR